MATEVGASMNFLLARVELRSDFIASEDSIETERDRLVEELNGHKMENEQLRSVYLKRTAR